MIERVVMPGKVAVVPEDVALSHPSFRTGQRISMDVAEDLWHRAGPIVVEHALKRLAEAHVRRHEGDVKAVLDGYLRDRAWAEPIIKDAIRETVREVIREMLARTPFGESVSERP